MGSKNITLKVDEEIYNAYKDHCKKKGLVISNGLTPAQMAGIELNLTGNKWLSLLKNSKSI